MFTPHSHPISGRPRTATTTDKEGLPRFTVRPWVLTPLREKVADWVRALIGWTFFCAFAVGLLNNQDERIEAIAAYAALGFLGHAALAAVSRLLLHRRTKIVMTTTSISVRRWYGWQNFDRNLEHRFALLNHDGSRAEMLQHDLEVRRASAQGRVVQKKAYYAESFHVVLVYAGHRRDLLSVYGQQNAAAIVARLQYCDRCLNEAARMGGGVHQRPEDEWTNTPGGMNHA